MEYRRFIRLGCIQSEGYEIYVCPVKTIPLYKGYAGDSFYVDGNSVNKLDGSWHDKGSFYKQAEISIANPLLTICLFIFIPVPPFLAVVLLPSVNDPLQPIVKHKHAEVPLLSN